MPSVPSTPAVKRIDMTPAEDPKVEVTMQVGDGPEVSIAKIDELRANEELDTIRQYVKDQYSIKKRKEAAIEMLEGIEEQWPEYNAVLEAEEKLAAAKNALQARRKRDYAYTSQTEKIAKIKREAKETNEILSDYLVNHFAMTHEKQVMIDEAEADAREIKVTAKLGKKIKYQTSMDFAS